MNASHTFVPLAPRTPAAVPSHRESDTSAFHRYRERDFGVGYGNSSGYALDRRYTSDWGETRFRCC